MNPNFLLWNPIVELVPLCGLHYNNDRISISVNIFPWRVDGCYLLNFNAWYIVSQVNTFVILLDLCKYRTIWSLLEIFYYSLAFYFQKSEFNYVFSGNFDGRNGFNAIKNPRESQNSKTWQLCPSFLNILIRFYQNHPILTKMVEFLDFAIVLHVPQILAKLESIN